jgi:hypothetical protein
MVSVTKALSPFSDFSMVRPDKLEAACERGSILHRAFALHASGLWLPELAAEYQGYFDSFCNWHDLAVEETLAVEEELVCEKYGFCGHPDWIGIIRGDKAPSLIDWKTGQAKMKAHRLQVAAYHHLAKEKYGVKRVLLMHPKANGGRASVVGHTGTLARDFATFLNCLSAYNYFYKEK